MSRLLRYSVAGSLDGFIATEDGGYDWLLEEPAIDFARYLEKIDTLIMGRGTWEVAQNPATAELIAMMDVYVVSTTIEPGSDDRITVIGGDVEARVAALKEEAGKDIWLFGGGVLFRTLMDAGLVDRVEYAVMPAILGAGIPLVPGLDEIAKLKLHSSELFPDTGIMLLKYDVVAEG